MLYVKGYQEDYISVLNFNLEFIEKSLSQMTDKAANQSKTSTVTKIERSVSHVRAIDSDSIFEGNRSDQMDINSEKVADKLQLIPQALGLTRQIKESKDRLFLP